MFVLSVAQHLTLVHWAIWNVALPLVESSYWVRNISGENLYLINSEAWLKTFTWLTK